MKEILRFSSGAPWEEIVGYSRAVRVGDTIEVTGTVAVDDHGQCAAPDDAYAQALHALGKIIDVVERAGGSRERIVRTRMYVTDMSLWKQVGRAHGEVLGDVRPATTLIEVSALIAPEYLVEIEATAVV